MNFLQKKYLIWMVLSLFYSYQYILRVLPAISLNELTEKFGVAAAQFGTFAGIYYIGYTAASIPLSIAIDRLNTKKVIVCTILCATAGLVPLMFNSWELTVIGRLISGIGSAGAILSLFKIIATYFEQRQSSKMLGIAVTVGLIGAIYGGKPLAHLVANMGFEGSIQVLVVLGIFMAIMTFILLPSDISQNAKEPLSVENILTDIKSIFTNKPLMLLAISGGLMVGGLEGFADGWSVITFETIHQWSKLDAAAVPSMIFIGMCIGASVLGYITEKTQKYYTTIVCGNIAMILSFAWILYGDGSAKNPMLAALFVVGFASAYQIVLMSKAGILSSVKLVTTGTAIANMIVMIFGSIYHSVIARVVHSTNTLESGFSKESITMGVGSVIYGLIIALPIIWLMSKAEKKSS